MSSADKFCKQFRPELFGRPDQDPKCLTLMVFLKEFFKKVDFEKISMQNYLGGRVNGKSPVLAPMCYIEDLT